jgi:hypothetical protein
VLAGADRWEQRAAAGLLEELREARRALAAEVVAHPPPTTLLDAVSASGIGRREQFELVVALVTDLRTAAQPSLPALMVVVREISRLAHPAK